MNIEVVAIASLTPDPKNARSHESGVPELAASLMAFGQRKNLVVWHNVVISGNGLMLAAQSLGHETIEIDRVPDDWTYEKAQAYAIVDNKTAELSAWDMPVLDEIRFHLDANGWDTTPFGFDPLVLTPPSEEKDPDAIPEVHDRAKTKLGDVYRLGDHRLICGDCRDAATIARLVGKRSVNVAFTSPPYAEQRKYDESSGFRPIPPDEYVEWFAPVAENVARHLADDGSWFVNLTPGADGLDT